MFMVEPAMQRVNGALPEHIYDDDKNRLCLFLPNSGEWDGARMLADTVIPWVSEWLFYYEIWLATEKWCGGGVHPARMIPAKTTKAKRVSRHGVNDRLNTEANVDSTQPDTRTHDQPRAG